MQHKIPQGSSKNTVAHRPNPQREANKAAIQKMAVDAVNRLGGYALIDDRYAIVDTTKYTVVPVIPIEVIPTGKSGIKDETDGN